MRGWRCESEFQPMSSYKITIRNYRSIPYNRPLTFSLNEGVTFILGINNVGKTNLLKFFYEFRTLFTAFRNGHIVGPVQAPNFDVIVHRSSLNDPILIEFEDEGAKCSVKVTASGDGM